jgi:hypothetical protein
MALDVPRPGQPTPVLFLASIGPRRHPLVA